MKNMCGQGSVKNVGKGGGLPVRTRLGARADSCMFVVLLSLNT